MRKLPPSLGFLLGSRRGAGLQMFWRASRVPRYSLILLALILGSTRLSAQVLNRWTALGAPTYFYCFAINPVDTNVLYAGHVYGVAKSTDSGNNWTLVDIWGYDFPNALVLNPLNPDTLYVGVEAAGTGGIGVYKSGNRGGTWSQVYSQKSVSCLALDPARPHIVYAGTVSGGVVKSTNSGLTWTLLNSGLGSLEIRTITASPGGSDVVYVGSSAGVHKSTDGGNLWTPINSGLPGGLVVNSFAIHPSDANMLLLGSSLDGLYKSTDGGSSWRSIGTGITTPKINSIAINPSNPDFMYVGAGTAGVFRSKDGGTSWSQIDANGVGPFGVGETGAVMINPKDPRIIFAHFDIGTTASKIYKRLEDLSVPALLGEYQPDASTVLLLHMNETGGTTVSDASSYGNHGTATGTTIVDGRFGKGRNFNGSSDYVQGSSNQLGVAANPFSVEAWIKTSSTAGQGIFVTSGSEIGLYVAGGGSGGFVDLDINNSAGSSTNWNGKKINDGKWHHVAAIRIGNKGYVYVDGRLDFVDDLTQNPGSASVYRVGAGPAGSNFAGVIDELRFSISARNPQGFNLQLPPKNLAATASGTIINLSWQNGGGAVGLLWYKIYRGTDSTNVSPLDSTALTSYANSGLTAGTRYFYRISAVDSTGFEGAKSYAANATTPTAVSAPTISTFSPTSGPISTSVTITGTNFDPTPANNIVYFGTVRGTVTAATATSLSARVPAGATYAPISVTTNGLTAYSKNPFIVTFSSSGTIDASSFAPSVDFSASSGSLYDLVVVDLDGDGKSDLAALNRTSNTLAVFRNTSTGGSINLGSFAAKVDFTTGNVPAKLAAGDLDGDGNLDIAVTNEFANTVSVFRNRSTSGSITSSSLAAKVDFVTGSNPRGIAIGDFNADGKPDLVVTNGGANSISVLENTSTIGSITTSSFATKVDFATGSNPYSVAVGDLDGDGKPDLAVSNILGNTISVLRNTSTGGSITSNSFATRVDFTTGSAPVGIAIGDLDGDGKAEIVVTNDGGTSVSVFRNTSTSGSITSSSFASRVNFTVGNAPEGVAIADLDGDGNPDLATANFTSKTVSVLRNTSSSGTISFATKVDFNLGDGPRNLAAGDLDGDGKPDLVASYNWYASVLQNTVAGGSGLTVTTNAATNITASSATLNGTVNPSGLSTTAYFEWGTSSTLSTSSTTSSQSIGSGTSLVSVTANLTGLNASTTYYYRVVGQNSAGPSRGSIVSFTTSAGGTAATVTTLSASSVSSTSATLNSSVNPNGLSTTAYFEWGTSSTLSSYNTTSSQSIGTGTSAVSVSANLSGLSPITTYYYRAVAQNSAGTERGTIGSFSTLTAGVAPTVTTGSPSNISTTSATLTGTVNPNGLSTTVVFQYGTSTSYGSQLTAAQSPVTGTSAVSVSTSLTGLSSGTTYHYRVVATNSAGTANGANQTFISYTSSFALSTNVSFPSKSKASDYSATDYRLVGLPGASDLSVGSLFTGTRNVDWQAYWDNGASSNYLVEYDGSATFRYSVGRAFWVISKAALNISRTVTSASLNALQEAEIPLNAGWNLITNPFTSPISWSKVQSANGVNAPIYTFNGSFSTSTSFDPYVGYYFFNGSPNTTLTSLKVPYASIFSKSTEVKKVLPGDWKVSILLTSGQITEGETVFGVSRDARNGLDVLDFRKPRGLSTMTAAYFDRSEWDPDFSAFATDIRSEMGDIERWDFSAVCEVSKPAALIFRGVRDVPEGFGIYLIDAIGAKFVDLRRDSVYRFTPASPLSKFLVLVGSGDIVKNEASEIVPVGFSLSQNFPNPFNPSTVIWATVPQLSEIRIEIYNALGQRVRTLHSGAVDAGRHWFEWDGRNNNGESMPSGAYYCVLRVSSRKSVVTKMILMR